MKRGQHADGTPRSKSAREIEPVVTVGVDFGTAGTGYAFSFHSMPDTIECKVGAQPASHAQFASLEELVFLQEPGGNQPRKILLNSNGTFNSFGDAAHRIHCKLVRLWNTD